MKALVKPFFFLIAIAAVFSFGQDKKKSPKDVYSLFPDHIGNEWIYAVSKSDTDTINPYRFRKFLTNKDTIVIRVIGETDTIWRSHTLTVWKLYIKHNNIIKKEEEAYTHHDKGEIGMFLTDKSQSNKLLNDYIDNLKYYAKGRFPWGEIIDTETITLPAGVFHNVTFILSATGGPGNGCYSDSLYIKDKTGIIKHIMRSGSFGHYWDKESWELVSYNVN